MLTENSNDPKKKLHLEVETKAGTESIESLLKIMQGLQQTVVAVNQQMKKLTTQVDAEGNTDRFLHDTNVGLKSILGYYQKIAETAGAVTAIQGRQALGVNRLAAMEQTSAEYALVAKLNRAMEQEWRLKVRNGEVSSQQIRRLRDEKQLKVVIAELDSKIRSGVGVDRYSQMRLDAATQTLQKLKASEAKAREDQARKLREQREQENLRKQAEAEDRKRTAEKRAAPQREIDRLRKQAEAEDRARAAEQQRRVAQTQAGLSLAAGESELEKKLSIRSRRAKLGTNRLALQEGLTLDDIKSMTDIPTLQVQGRLAKVRQTLTNLTQGQLVEAQRLQNAIQDRIRDLKQAMKPSAPSALSAQQLFQRQVQAGGFRLSQLSSGDISKALPGISTLHALSPYESAQKARIQAARGRGDDAGLKDAQDALDRIIQRKKEIQALDRRQYELEREANKSTGQRASDTLKAHQQDLKARQLGTEISLQQEAAEARAARARESARIAQIASNKINLAGIKDLNHAYEVQDQLAASIHRQRRAANETERLQEKALQEQLKLRGRELARRDRLVAETPAERAARIEESRRTSRERLFGDGGANILAIQAGLMANYQILGGIQSLFSGAASSAIEFDKSLKQLQAISAATRNEMALMKTALIEVAQGSKFGAAEVAQASVLLAQAGLSVSDIQKTMASVIALATASGSDLAKSVDVMTSVLSVFDMEAGKSAEVANKLTAALNLSKLDIDKLALGMQYAGNAAADAGVTFNELVSGLSAMANAGIRSGSTLGTGLRQLFVDIQKPSDNFKAILDRLGISLNEVDIRSQGFEGTLRNLQEKGFTTADAFQAFQIRSASAFAALSNNIDVFHNMQEAIDGTNAAVEANLVQMGSLSVQYDHLKSNLGILAAEGLRPLLVLLRDVTQGFAHMLEGVDKTSGGLKIAVSGLATVFGTLAVLWGVNLATGVVKLTGGLRSLLTITALTTVATNGMTLANTMAKRSQDALAASTTILGGALARLRLVAAGTVTLFSRLLGFAGWALPLAAGGYLLWKQQKAVNAETEKLSDNLDQAKSKANALGEQLDKQRSTMDSLEKAVNTLNTRYGRYSQHASELRGYVRELSSQFRDQGLTLDDLANRSIDSVINKLEELRRKLSQEYVATIRLKSEADVEVLKQEQAQFQSSAVSRLGEANQAMQNLGAKAPRRAEVARLLQATNRYINGGGVIRKGALGFNGVGEVNAGLADILSDLTTRRPSGSSEVIAVLTKIREALDTQEVAKARRAQAGQAGKRPGAAIQTELLTSAARADETSGFATANQLRRSLSVNQTAGTANLSFLDQGLGTLRTKRKDLEGEMRALQAGRDIEQLSEQTQARIQALTAQVTAISQLESDYEQARKPLWEIELASRKELAGIELQAARDKVKRLEEQRSAEQNSVVIQKEIGPALQKALEEEANAQARLDAITQEKIKMTAEATKAAEAARRTQLADKKKAARIATAQEVTRANDTWRDLMNAEEQAPLAKLVKDYASAFTKLQAGIKRQLREGKDALDQGEEALRRKIQLASLGAKGIRTTNPGDPGGDYDVGQLGIRARMGAQFRAEALRRELINYQKTQNPLRLQELEKSLPEVEQAAAQGQQILDKIRKERDAAAAEHERLLEELTRKKAANASITTDETKRLQDARNELTFYDQLLSKQQAQTDEALRAVDALKQKRSEISEAILSQEGPLDALFESLKTGMEGLTQSISEGLQRVITSAGDTSEAFREMANNVLASMLKIMTDKLAQQFMGMLMDFGFSLFGGGIGIGNSSAGKSGITNTISRRTGGPVRLASGGAVVGSTMGRDSVPAVLQPGEFVVQRSAVEAVGPNFMTGLNNLTSATMRQGTTRTQRARQEGEGEKGGKGQVNVWVVTPDQQPGGLSKDDVIVTVSDNIARNGSIRRLIKQVQMGG